MVRFNSGRGLHERKYMYQFKQIAENIYVLSFDNEYDLAMHFVRYQEFYECPNGVFRSNCFSLIDYMEWYAKENGNQFTYPQDWGGFNIPGWVLMRLLGVRAIGDLEISRIKDRNKYDDFMERIVTLIYPDWNPLSKESDWPTFYVLGCLNDDVSTMDHEIAHALYYTSKEYKAEVTSLLEEAPDIKKHLSKALLDGGYTFSVLDDECQAYLATGLVDKQKKYLRLKRAKRVSSTCNKFNKVFKSYKEKLIKV